MAATSGSIVGVTWDDLDEAMIDRERESLRKVGVTKMIHLRYLSETQLTKQMGLRPVPLTMVTELYQRLYNPYLFPI